MRQIYWKHLKSVGNLIIYKFIDEFMSFSVITDEFMSLSVIIDRFRINLSVNPSINLATDNIYR